MITAVVVAGLAALWLWVVLNDDDGILAPVKRLLDKNRVTAKWAMCPWCSGAWFAIIGSVVLYHPADMSTVITAVAAAAVTGIAGSYIVQEN